MTYASFPQLSHPTVMDQLNSAVMFVNACNQNVVTDMQQSWKRVEDDILKHEGLELAHPPFLKFQNRNFSALDTYLKERFTPAMRLTLMKRAKDLLNSSPVKVLKNLKGYDSKIVSDAMDLGLIWGEPAHTLFRSASLVYNRNPEVAIERHKAWIDGLLGNHPRVLQTYHTLVMDYVFEYFTRRDRHTIDQLMKILAERPKFNFYIYNLHN